METMKRKMQRYINYYHLLRAVIASSYYQNPSRRLKVIGVTGTDGKTTTTFLIYHILKTAGKRVSMLSSVYAKVGRRKYDTGLHMTTPDATLVQKLLKTAVEHGDEYFVLETTSHAFDQNRNWGVRYKVGVVTNITPEHLDYHKTYDKYLLTKAKIIPRSDTAIVNRDDASYARLKEYASSRGGNLKTYGIEIESDFQKDLKTELRLNITDFNNYNYLAAYSVCKQLGIADETIFEALKSFSLPKGRMDVVYDKEFKVIIDFAHTANSIEQLLSYLKKSGKGRIIHVFGAAGLRDRIKRPHMGEVSARHANVIFVTEEDYRTEDPRQIANEIVRGIATNGFTQTDPNTLDGTSDHMYAILLHRDEAIKKAVSIARRGDIVVCTGKSHEKSLARGGLEAPWDEYEIVNEAIAEAHKKK